MGISSIGQNGSATKNAKYIKQQLDILQLQLATGKRASNYRDLGTRRLESLSAHGRLQSLDAFKQNVSIVDTRLTVIQSSLTRFDQLAQEQRASNLQTAYVSVDDNQSAEQKSARQRLDELVSLLNQDAGGRRLFSGRATDSDASISSNDILNGQPSLAGLTDVIDERRRADLGSDNRGRATITNPTATSVRLSETVSGPFGFKIAGVTSTLSNVTVTDTVGPPHSVNADFVGQPSAAQSFNVSFNLPDGTTSVLSLKATESLTPSADEFTIGASPAITQANFQAALDAKLQKTALSALRGASALKAGEDFFNVDATHVPQRVDTSVLTAETATALRNATPTDTVIWYQGDDAADNARNTSTSRIDEAVTVGYGMRANELAIRELMKNLAVFSAVDFPISDASSGDAYTDLAQRVRSDLARSTGQTINTMRSEMSYIQIASKSAKDRHIDIEALFSNVIDNVENISTEEVGSKILDLQTRLQASFQVTANLSQLSLVNYLR